MHEIHNIRRINKEQLEALIPAHTAEGKHVVAEYHGLHFVDFYAYGEEATAAAKINEIAQQVGRSVVYHAPTGHAVESQLDGKREGWDDLADRHIDQRFSTVL